MKKWNAVVLAGDRGPNDPVIKAVNVPGKAAISLQGKTLLERVISVLNESEYINEITLVGPSDECVRNEKGIAGAINNKRVTRLFPESGPSASAIKGVLRLPQYPILLITCDLALLSSGVINSYCKRVEQLNADFVIGAIEYSSIRGLMPKLKKTKYQFKDQEVCFANVFAILNESGLRAIEYWQNIEHSRKKPIKVIKKIDWLSIIRYKLKLLSLEQAAQSLSKKMNINVLVERFLIPELAIDIDSVHDYEILSSYLK